jgi:GR25 family glycosyltransferase involved in LPS biosynthesis
MNVDHTFVINLKHRKDRKKQMIKELKRVGIDNYEFFRAIKPAPERLDEWNPLFLSPVPQWFKNTGGNEQQYKIGALGCMLSHLEVIKLSLERNYEHVLILEDDTSFTIDSWTNYVETMKPYVDVSFGLLYLTGNHRGATLQRVNEKLHRIKGTYTTGSYILHKSAMEFILKNICGFLREIDVFYANIVQIHLPCYCVFPHSAKQTEGYSDIVQRHVEYKLDII